jgi:hypothetical protein
MFVPPRNAEKFAAAGSKTRLRFSPQLSSLPVTEKGAVRKNDVIKEVDAQNFGGTLQFFGDFIVFWRRDEPPGWMVMRTNHGAGAVKQRIRKHFAGVDDGLVHKPYGNDAHRKRLVRAVQGNADEPLLTPVRVVPYQIENILRMAYSRSGDTPPPPPEFQHGNHGTRLALAKPGHLGKLFHTGYAFLLIQPFQQFSRKDTHILPLYPRVKQNRKQFFVRKRSGTMFHEFFSRTVFNRKRERPSSFSV